MSSNSPLDINPHIVAARAQDWERCNWCGYTFKQLTPGIVWGKDVVRHKAHCKPSKEALTQRELLLSNQFHYTNKPIR